MLYAAYPLYRVGGRPRGPAAADARRRALRARRACARRVGSARGDGWTAFWVARPGDAGCDLCARLLGAHARARADAVGRRRRARRDRARERLACARWRGRCSSAPPRRCAPRRWSTSRSPERSCAMTLVVPWQRRSVVRSRVAAQCSWVRPQCSSANELVERLHRRRDTAGEPGRRHRGRGPERPWGRGSVRRSSRRRPQPFSTPISTVLARWRLIVASVACGAWSLARPGRERAACSVSRRCSWPRLVISCVSATASVSFPAS